MTLSSTTALHNTFTRLTRDRRLKVLIIGNSVTAGAPDGHLPGKTPSFYIALERWLKANFPGAEITVIPKIIYAIGPEVFLFWLDQWISAEKPDLVLVEFGAANGAWGDKGRTVTEPATEGFIHRLRRMLPEADCVMMMGIFKTMLDDYQLGKTPASVTFQHKVAGHYGCVAVDAERDLAERILAGEAWEDYMDDFIHPGDKGYQLYGKNLLQEFERHRELFETKAVPEILPHPLPATTLLPHPWVNPIFVPAKEVLSSGGFELKQDDTGSYLKATGTGARGFYIAPSPARIAGILLHENGVCGDLEVTAGGSSARLLSSADPHFTIKDRPEVRYYRHFFGGWGLPLTAERIDFQVPALPAGNVELAGFFLVG